MTSTLPRRSLRSAGMPAASGRSPRRVLAALATGALALALPVTLPTSAAAVAAAPTDLFLSEVVEGSSNNKALEIYNGTSAPIPLWGYSVQMFFNGSPTVGLTIDLTGTVAAGDVFVLAQASAASAVLAAADQTSTASWFNGDDAITLRKNGVVIDTFGQTGFDPGAEWGTGLTSTADNTLQRLATICTGDPDGSNAFDPSTEWNGFATDTFTGLGSHTATCGTTPPTDDAPAVASITPAAGAINVAVDANVVVTFTEPVALGAGALALTCGGTPVAATVTGGPTAYTLDPDANLTPDAACTVTVTAAAVTDTDTVDPPDAMAADVTSGFTVAPPVVIEPCDQDFTPIPAIQGSGASVAITGAVTTEGVVVADYEGPSPALRGFYLQDPAGDGDPATSDGIFVFNGSNLNSVALGDLVRITGTAGENQGQSQVSVSSTNILNCGTGTVTPTDVTLPVASATHLERYEGMLTTFPQTLFVTEHFQLGRFGQVVVSSGGRLQQPTNVVDPGPAALALQAENNLNRLIVDDTTQAQNPDPIIFGRGGQPLSATNTLRGGDTLTGATGILAFTWGGNNASPNAYRLRPTAPGGTFTFEAANARPTAAPEVGGTLQVAGMNQLNYFNTFDGLPDTVDNCRNGAGGAPTDCRGADTAAEFARQHAKTVAAILKLGVEVLGVNEVENDGYAADSAIADLVDRLNAATAPGTYAFIDADAGTGQVNALGTDAIKVGQIYQPGVVTPVGQTAVLNTDAFVNGGDASARNRPSLAQAYRVNATGAVFIVDVNHLKSKGSACETPDLLDGQGNCSIVRTNSARTLIEWLATDPTETGDPDVLLVGDYNSYAKEAPIRALEDGGFINLITDRLGEDGYSYVFDGQWGHLDQALGSTSLDPQVTGVGEYHINADEPSVLDYNMDFKTAAQIVSLYAPDEFRTSDHDPVLIGLTPNAPPTVNPGGPYAVNEGGSLTLTATGSDPNVGDTLTYAWDLDGNGTYETSGASTAYSALALDGPTSRTVGVQVTDQLGLTGTASVTITVANVAPTVSAEFVDTLVECGFDNTTLTVTFSDPAAADTHTVAVDWGDGHLLTVNHATSPLTLPHTYAEAGAHSATVTVTDDDGGATSTIANVAVAYPSSGILAPLVRDGSPTFKSGQTIPVQVQFFECDGSVATDVDPIVTVSYQGSPVLVGSMRLEEGIWVFQLRTSLLPSRTGTYTVTITVPETGQVETVTFRLRR